MTTQMDDMTNDRMDVSKWVTTGKTIPCQKDPGKGNAVDNYQSMSGLALM